MAEKPADKSNESSKQALDLNSLSGLDFGPSWAGANAKQPSTKQYESRGSRDGGGGSRGKDRRAGSGGGGAGGGGFQDRRTRGRPSGGSGGGDASRRDDRDDRRRPRRDDRQGGASQRPEFFKPTVHVDIYPQDEAFEALVNRLRSTVRTYQLFEIAQLILQKPERFVVVVANLPESGGKPAPLYFSVPGHLPFPTEDAAVNHVLADHLDLFFDVEPIEIDPPKGNFVMVNRCGITGELLGPPNYHRYQEFLQRHYAARITGMSFDRFVSKVETVKEQEAIDAWLASMTKGARYTVKERQEGEPESFESMEAARNFLLQHRKDKMVGSAEAVRFAGRDIERLPKGDIRRSVEAYVEQQRHFPLESANNIRGRLRRHKFTVYKKGSKGVSYVCAVKRKFRDNQSTFTDSIQELIEFIEKHPNIPASKLPKQYIGIDTEKQQPEKLEMAEAEIAAAAAKAEETEKTKEAEEAEEAEEANIESEPAAVADASNSPQSDVAEAPDSSQETPAAPAPDAAASTEATPKAELSAEDQKRLNQLMLDLRWLIVEGYVTEYGDGRLFAAPPMPEPKKEKPARKPEVRPKKESEVKPESGSKKESEAKSTKGEDKNTSVTESKPEEAKVDESEIEAPRVEAPKPEEAKADEPTAEEPTDESTPKLA